MTWLSARLKAALRAPLAILRKKAESVLPQVAQMRQGAPARKKRGPSKVTAGIHE